VVNELVLYQCLQDRFEAFEQVYEERFEHQYGFFGPMSAM
jgi:hypothetical protein